MKGSFNVEGNISNQGENHFYYYCYKCFTDFDILTSYTKYRTDKPKESGNTGVY